jgi:LacI family transcriptional regulator
MIPEPPAQRISQRELARMLGISHVTVSMALRNNTRVSEPVRKRVHELAEKLGYRPDPMLSSLANYRLGKAKPAIHSQIAWLNAWKFPEQLRELKEFDAYWRGADAAAEKHGYRLEEFRMSDDLSARRLHQIFQARGILGILLPPHGYVNPAWEDFPWDQYSIVRFGRSLESPASHLVTADQLTNAIVAFQAMRSRGYRRIGFVTKEADISPRGHHFAAGFLSIEETVEENERVPLLKLPARPAHELSGLLGQWMKQHRPDAILTSVADTGQLLAAAGYRVPDDVGLAVTSVLDCDVDAGIDQHPEEIGRVGLLMLNSLITDGARGIPEIFRQNLVEGSWVDGASLPRRN